VLFDLQSPRRRRVIRVTFAALAAVFAISFVFLGVGSGGGFSVGDIFGTGGGDTGASAFEDDIDTAEQRVAANPNDTAALAQLVTLHYQAGNSEVDSEGNLSSDGVQQMRGSVDAWNKYLQATNGQPQRGPALIAIQALSVLARVDFNEAAQASTGAEQLQSLQATRADLLGVAEAQLTVAEQQPTFANYANAAQYFYLAGKDQEAQAAIAQAQAQAKGNQGNKLASQLKPAQNQGATFTKAIDQLTKQQQQGASAGGGNPLGGLSGGGGGLGGIGTGGL
jgi:hypothetical protein